MAVLENNKIYHTVVLEQKLNLDEILKKKGFYIVYYLDGLNRSHFVKLSLFDITF
jgi:hypothetical protein